MHKPSERRILIKRNTDITTRPDVKNQNKIKQASSPIKQVKKYLQNIKQPHQPSNNNINHLSSTSNDQNIQQLPFNQQAYMRNRIEQLQLQNNELRSMFKEFQVLLARNKELEENMMRLLQDIQSSREQKEKSKNNHYYQTYQASQQLQIDAHGFSFSQKGTPLSKQIQTKPTQITNFHQIDLKILQYNIPEIKAFSSFNSSREKELEEENHMLKMQNKRIYELFQNSLKEYLQMIEKKFKEYIQNMEERFMRMYVQRSNSSSNSARKSLNIMEQYNYVEGVSSRDKDQQTYQQKQKLPTHHNNFNKNIFPSRLKDVQNYTDIHLYCTPGSSSSHFSKSNSHNNIKPQSSKVNIHMQNSNNSDLAFRQKHQAKLQVTPASESSNNYFKNIQIIQSSKSQELMFEQLVVQKIFENIVYLKQNLTHLWNKRNVLSDSFSFLERRIQFQLNNIFNTYFQEHKPRTTNLKQSNKTTQIIQKEVLQQNAMLKHKIHQINEQIRYLRLQLSFKTSQNPSENPTTKRIKGDETARKRVRLSSRQLVEDQQEQQYVHKEYLKQFEMSKMKLMEMIEVIRAFNDEYIGIIRKSSTSSLLQGFKPQY